MDSLIASELGKGFLIGSGLTGLGAVLGAFFGIFVLGIYVYSAWAWMTIGKKLKYKKAWLAWIPIANIAMFLQLGGFHWAWVFLVLIPVLGWIPLMVLMFICQWKIFERRKYPGWWALIPLLGFIPKVGFVASVASLVVLGIVAWQRK